MKILVLASGGLDSTVLLHKAVKEVGAENVVAMNTFYGQKLLRVLQEHEIEKVGGGKPIPIDVRFISATRQNLAEMVERGEFREDTGALLRRAAGSDHARHCRHRQEDTPESRIPKTRIVDIVIKYSTTHRTKTTK